MPYIEEDKRRGVQEDYIPDFLEDIIPPTFEFKEIAGVNTNQINTGISIES